MDYQATLDYLYAKLPMFTKLGSVALKKDLYNTITLCTQLGNPHDKFKSIHVAGTNGKGSTSHMLAAIFQQAGYKTGLYTSPHLKDFRERIKINGEMVSEDFVIEFVNNQRQLIEEINPSFFEVTVAMAFSYFANEAVDIAIIEVGLGGRLDSTNIITPELSVITNISLDHTNILGNTTKEIASEKAGIIKKGIPVVIGERQENADQVFLEKASMTGSDIFFADEMLSLTDVDYSGNLIQMTIIENEQIILKKLSIDLTGSYQLKNILPVIKAAQLMRLKGYTLSNMDINNALRHVKQLTGLQGRWQVLGQNPLIICDTGHNEAGVQEVVNNIQRQSYRKLHMVIGMVKDKDISAVLKLLPDSAQYYFCAPDLERALSANELKAAAQMANLFGDAYTSVHEAYQAALNHANSNDFIFIGGSTFVVAEVV
ncbi:MAG: folylpolyglutamate synthase/dihydrofolate synthase family protein [Bacteroidota bacterium]